MQDHLALAHWIAERGVDPLSIDSLLISCIQCGRHRIADWLLELGANVNKWSQGTTALFAALDT